MTFEKAGKSVVEIGDDAKMRSYLERYLAKTGKSYTKLAAEIKCDRGILTKYIRGAQVGKNLHGKIWDWYVKVTRVSVIKREIFQMIDYFPIDRKSPEYQDFLDETGKLAQSICRCFYHVGLIEDPTDRLKRIRELTCKLTELEEEQEAHVLNERTKNR